MNVAQLFLSTPIGAFFMGLSLMLGLISGGLSIGFFIILRQKSLLYFGVSILLCCIFLSFTNQNPQELLDVGGDPIFLRVLNVVVAIAVYSYYQLVVTSFARSSSKGQQFRSVLFFYIFVLTMIFRILVVLFLDKFLISLAALASAAFLMSTIVFALSHTSAQNLSARLVKLGCCLFSSGLMIFPLLRSGVLPDIRLETYVPFILIGSIAIFSTIWLLGLILLAKELHEKSQMASLRNMARAFIQLRDLMNTPLQTVQFSVSLLRSENQPRKEILDLMDRALVDMRKVNKALARYEKDVDWAQTDDFLHIENIDDKV